MAHMTYFDCFLYSNYWRRSINVGKSAYTSLEQPHIPRIMACYDYLSKYLNNMLAFVTHVTLVLGCFNIKISANWHTIEKAA